MIAWPPPISARCMMPAGGSTRSWPRATRSAITDGGRRVLQHHAAAADVADARRVDRLLQVEAAIDQVDQDLRVPLGLDVAAHDAVGHQQPAVLEHHRRDQRVERPFPGLEAVRMAGLSTKPVPRLCSMMPVSPATMPEPNELNRLLMNDTAFRSLSTTVK